jgi:hypothetical protein
MTSTACKRIALAPKSPSYFLVKRERERAYLLVLHIDRLSCTVLACALWPVSCEWRGARLVHSVIGRFSSHRVLAMFVTLGPFNRPILVEQVNVPVLHFQIQTSRMPCGRR